MLQLTEVSRNFRERRILNGVSLVLPPGEYCAIVGESGSGKSTLLNLIAGLDMPDSGRVSFAGRDLAAMDDDERTLLRRAQMGFVFQAFHLLPHLTVAENVALPLALNGRVDEAARQRVDELLAAIGLDGRADDYPRELSGGEMQRTGIARALVHRPQLVLADEPTGNLDLEAAGRVLEVLRAQVKRDGASAILVTHSMQAAAAADQVYRLSAAGLQLC